MKQSSNNNVWIWILVLVLIGIVTLSFFTINTRQPDKPITSSTQKYTTKTLAIEDKVTIQVEVSDTPEKTTLGLSYRESLPENQGMLFIFPHSHVPTFWMKGMNLPLDMIWIDENNMVVDITQNVPQPLPETLESNLPHYSPKVPAKMVLEVNAGFVEKHSVQVTDRITISDY